MERRVQIGTIASGAVLLAASSMAAAAASSSDLALFGKDPGNGKAYACYTRHYDAAHLAAHPKQNTREMTLFVNSFVDSEMGRQYTLEIGVSFRKSKKLFQVSGGCGLSDDGKNALNCGIDCDGGNIDVSVKDADSILVSIPDGARTWEPESGEEPPPDAKFGPDDKLFRLDRTALQDCLSLIADDDIKAEIAATK
jgi:hypothetical protein